MAQLHQLPSVPFAAGGAVNISLKDLPVAVRGRIPHLKAVIFEAEFAPTFTTAPTTVGHNNIVTTMDFWDGRVSRFVGGFNVVRFHERFNTGKNRIADADTDAASTGTRYIRRVLHMGPPQAAGENDFVIPTGALQAGEIRLQFGALTDMSADTTAMTGTIRPYAVLEVLDEVRIPPAYQTQRINLNASDSVQPGRALLVNMALLDSGSFGAIAAGDFGSFRVDTGLGEVVSGIPGEVLTAQYHDDFEAGDFGGFSGEPRGTNDDNVKAVNRASPTAIGPAASDLQPILWMKPGTKLSKLPVAETNVRLQWDGSQQSGVLMLSRILPQPPSVLAAIGGAALKAINRTQKDFRPKTLSKKPYGGPLVEFMPYVVKV
jgi:hypothetical protein